MQSGNKMFSLFSFLLTALMVQESQGNAARVLELSDRFLELKRDGLWLIKFYAPWCGHCKRLEPIFSHVAQALHDTPIRVGRVDCTRFPSVATEFHVGGFPTIIFMKGDSRHVYKGERSTDEIVEYAKRMAGPHINEIDQGYDNIFNKVPIFFGFVGKPEGILWEAFNATATEYQAQRHFYYFQPHQVPNTLVENKELPLVFVHKDEAEMLFDPRVPGGEGGEVEPATFLSDWVRREMFGEFVKVTRTNFQGLLGTKKFIVMAVVEEDKLGNITPEMEEFKDMVESVIRSHKVKYHERFQFGWVGSPELANSVAMTTLPIPSLLIVNSTSYHHHIPDDEPNHLTAEAIATFLEQLLNQSATAYGGNSIAMKMYRNFYEAKTSLVDMWIGNPILTTVLFGLPLGFLSLIFYSICCADIMDAVDEDDYIHEKKE